MEIIIACMNLECLRKFNNQYNKSMEIWFVINYIIHYYQLLLDSFFVYNSCVLLSLSFVIQYIFKGIQKDGYNFYFSYGIPLSLFWKSSLSNIVYVIHVTFLSYPIHNYRTYMVVLVLSRVILRVLHIHRSLIKQSNCNWRLSEFLSLFSVHIILRPNKRNN